MTATATRQSTGPTPAAKLLGRAIYEAEDPYPFPGVTWDTVPESFRKLYIHYGTKVEAALYAHPIRPSAPPLMVPPRLAAEIEEWAVWWKAGGAEKTRRTRRAHEILADLASSLR